MAPDPPQRLHHLRSLSDVSSPPAFTPGANGSASGEISTAIVHLLRRRAGRGPTQAKTVIAEDLVIVTVRNCLTIAETTLADHGRSELAMQIRTSLHDAIRDEAVAVVERISGRDVVAYLADQHHDPDIAVLAFVFGPRVPPESVG